MKKGVKNEFLEAVNEFHTAFKQPILNKFKLPKNDRVDLRLNLLYEELEELEIAINDNNLVEVADALVDIQYVLCGAILEFGLHEKFIECFKAIHKSNMSKLCKTKEEALESCTNYTKLGVDVRYEKHNDYYIIYRQNDNKVLKSINYKPVNLKLILNN